MSYENQSLLKLTVNNHPGVLSHICGLFARRSYNIEGVMIRPIANSKKQKSCVWLLVNEVEKLPQLIRQTEKLLDVISVDQQNIPGSIFDKTEEFFV